MMVDFTIISTNRGILKYTIEHTTCVIEETQYVKRTFVLKKCKRCKTKIPKELIQTRDFLNLLEKL